MRVTNTGCYCGANGLKNDRLNTSSIQGRIGELLQDRLCQRSLSGSERVGGAGLKRDGKEWEKPAMPLGSSHTLAYERKLRFEMPRIQKSRQQKAPCVTHKQTKSLPALSPLRIGAHEGPTSTCIFLDRGVRHHPSSPSQSLGKHQRMIVAWAIATAGSQIWRPERANHPH
ncbi:hypothetical protein VTI74DRAFT_10203 [Chaetomium olivicolor]